MATVALRSAGLLGLLVFLALLGALMFKNASSVPVVTEATANADKYTGRVYQAPPSYYKKPPPKKEQVAPAAAPEKFGFIPEQELPAFEAPRKAREFPSFEEQVAPTQAPTPAPAPVKPRPPKKKYGDYGQTYYGFDGHGYGKPKYYYPPKKQAPKQVEEQVAPVAATPRPQPRPLQFRDDFGLFPSLVQPTAAPTVAPKPAPAPKKKQPYGYGYGYEQPPQYGYPPEDPYAH
ncbi:hypothetical protein FVE85_0191 [Porphyridium purpureum]|uniref:Uncharacterized protein n=1 Tax=Porphyridium purpureum TaxID=35688 RepID=A0A5J4Z075_PORPP|nr:hypothetical protein FVE85_0191 [Porphyridium purpureum]|eukprot:POR2149..scf208_2